MCAGLMTQLYHKFLHIMAVPDCGIISCLMVDALTIRQHMLADIPSQQTCGLLVATYLACSPQSLEIGLVVMWIILSLRVRTVLYG